MLMASTSVLLCSLIFVGPTEFGELTVPSFMNSSIIDIIKAVMHGTATTKLITAFALVNL